MNVVSQDAFRSLQSHIGLGIDLMNDVRPGYLTIVAVELTSWIVELRRLTPDVADTLTLTSDADGLAAFAKLVTLPAIDEALFNTPDVLRQTLEACGRFIEVLGAYIQVDCKA